MAIIEIFAKIKANVGHMAVNITTAAQHRADDIRLMTKKIIFPD